LGQRWGARKLRQLGSQKGEEKKWFADPTMAIKTPLREKGLGKKLIEPFFREDREGWTCSRKPDQAARTFGGSMQQTPEERLAPSGNKYKSYGRNAAFAKMENAKL